MKFSYIVTTTILICGLTGQSAGQSFTTTAASLDQTIERSMKESGIVGAGAAIIVDKRVVWSKGYGYSDLKSKRPFTTDTIMNIASISKVFTGVCMMRALEEGKLSLDEDINKYLPFKVTNPNFPDERITLRSIATHTSGLIDRDPVYSEKGYFYGGDPPEALGDFLRNYFEPGGKYYSKDSFLKHKPGTYREYSNIAAALAGYIVERVTGMRLNVYSRRIIFKPLKMKHTGWFLSEIDRKRHSKLYEKKADQTNEIELYGLTTYPDGGVRTSVKDLTRFYLALLNNGELDGVRILSRESISEMQTLRFTADKKPENVDISKLNSGLFWATKRNVSLIGHSGSDPGVKADMLSDLNKGVAVILFTNTSFSEERMSRYHVGIFDELFKYGTQLKRSKN
ncbi:MAG: serine hydrolase domain-containing protein [Pyrinomonadaceae bacterium]